MRYRFALLAGAVVLAAGCATSASSTSAEGTPAPKVRHSASLITRDEIEHSASSNVYELIQMLRPNMLRTRGAESINQGVPVPVAYVDGVRFGDAPELRSLPVTNVESIRYLSPNEATSRFGTGHTAGAILVTTRH